MKVRWGFPDVQYAPAEQSGEWLELASYPVEEFRFAILTAVGACIFVLSAVVWGTLVPTAWDGGFFDVFPMRDFVVVLFSVVFIHELAHLIGHPDCGLSNTSIVGVVPELLAPYALYCGELSRGRYLSIVLTPLVLLSVLPLLFAIALEHTWPWLSLVSIVNAAVSAGDLVHAGWIIYSLPPNAKVRPIGDAVAWRKEIGK